MTDNLPAVHEPTAVVQAPADTDSWVAVAGDVFKLAGAIAQTEFVPRSLRGSEPATAAAILYGREVGLPPMTALTQVHVIEGRPSISAEGQRALVFAAGHDLQIIQSDGGVCRLRGRRRGWEAWTTVEWTIDTARAAGLLGKKGSAWGSYPRAMLLARATTELCRMIFPDVIRGFRGLEEARDLAGEYDDTEQTPEAPTTSSGTVQRKRRPTRKAPAAQPMPEPQTRPTTVDVPVAAPSPEPPQAPPVPHPVSVPDAGEDPAPGEHHQRDEKPDDVEAAPELATKAQIRLVMGNLSGIDKDLTTDEQRPVRLAVIGTLAGHPIESAADLTKWEASRVIDTLAKVKDRAALDRLVAAYDVQAPEAGGGDE